MKKFYISIIVLSLSVISVSGCNSDNSNNTSDLIRYQTVDNDTSDNTAEIISDYSYVDVSSYEGTWTEHGVSQSDILQNGGAYLVLTANDDNSVSGTYCCIEASTLTTSTITFDHLSSDNSYSCSYDNDGLSNSGVITLSFENSSISIDISDVNTGTDNTSGWTSYTSTLIHPSDGASTIDSEAAD